MTTAEMDALIALVGGKCARRRWYADDMSFEHGWLSPPLAMPGGERVTQYQPGEERQRFLQRRATETDLRLTEQVLGVPLPPLLSRIYLTVANGGFGRGYGLLGAPGAALFAPDPDPNGDYGVFHIDGAHGQFHRDDSLKRAIPLCHWGCWIRSVLDPDSGCVLRRYLDDEVEAASLSEWLVAWAASDEPLALWELTPVTSPISQD